MVYAQVQGSAGYGDEVVADGHVQSFVAHIGVCRLHDVPYLHRREHIHGTALPFRTACFHLHKDQVFPVLHNQVDLSETAAEMLINSFISKPKKP